MGCADWVARAGMAAMVAVTAVAVTVYAGVA